MTDEDFRRAKEDARIGEDYIADILRITCPQTKTATELYGDVKFSDYDILIPERNLTVEVKTDAKSKQKDNIAIEYESYGLPSGLSVTKADYWVQLFWDSAKQAWYRGSIKTDRLRELVKGQYKTTGGFKKLSSMYLVPVWFFVACPDVTVHQITDDVMLGHLEKQYQYIIAKDRITTATTGGLQSS